QPAVRVHDTVVPRWNDLARGRLCFHIPGWRDVGLRALKDHEGVGVARKILPDGVRARDMGAQRAVRSIRGTGGNLERNVVRIEARGTERHQGAEGMRGDESVQDLGTGFFKMAGE